VGGEGESQGNPTGAVEYHLFLARVVFLGKLAFFLAGNRKNTVAFEKEVSLKG